MKVLVLSNNELKEKEIKTKNYFNEICYMFDWLDKHPQYKMVKYKFTFAYGYCLYYTEK